MVLEVIYVVRHGFRSNWIVDAQTGTYTASVRSPTGIASDPALASYGVEQARQLAAHLAAQDPPIDRIYSSPFYRCLQTLSPTVKALEAQRSDARHGASSRWNGKVHVEPGLGEFYGLARFDHPSPAPMAVLHTHFAHLHAEPEPVVVPAPQGESIPQLHDRIAYCLHHVIARLDADVASPRALLISTHAASMICIGRALTGRMPADEGEEDFRCYTCTFTRFVRKPRGPYADVKSATLAKWQPYLPDQVPDIGWRDGVGVQGGWTCEVNGDCSFLSGGEERGWRFSGDESFLRDPNAFNDSANTAKETGMHDSILKHSDGAGSESGKAGSRL